MYYISKDIHKMRHINFIHSSVAALSFSMIASVAIAQRGEIESQTYEIVKEKSIEFPAANRLFDKVQPAQTKADEKKVRYSFIDPSINITSPKLTPVVPVSSDEQNRKDQPALLNNYIKLGAGNYGRFLAEGFGSSRTSEDLVVTGSLKHLSASSGPVDGKNSANANTNLRLGGKYIGEGFKVDGGVEYNRANYYFYGYQPLSSDQKVDRDTIRQTINQFGIHLGFDNTNAKSLVDYSVKTALNTFKDRYDASELDWGTTISGVIPISEPFYALFEASAFINQRVDAETYNRNLFRVKPTFKYVTGTLSVSAGVNVVNETDNVLDINRTKAYPVLNVDVVPVRGLHVFAGWNGDLVRNTLRSLISENQWLGPNVLIANTQKNSDIYAGVKGEVESGVNYEGKVSYTSYRNFYGFNNSYTDTTRFSVVYDGGKTNVLTISAQLGYNYNDIFKTSLKGSFYDYGVDRLEEAWHRPTATLNFTNALTVSKKLFITADLYVLSGIKAKNFQSGKVSKLPAISDLNFKIDYLLTRNFSAFIAINNLLGKEYQRYQYYPQQGINFIGGLSFSF
jgi:hypothetical protein